MNSNLGSLARILIVEDESKIAGFLKKGLEEEGYAATVASDGELGLQVALSQDFDLIVLDLTLPLKDGMEICKILREKGKTLPIIMLTARDSVQDKVQGLDLGADDYITKPFDVDEFLARVRSHIRKSREKIDTSLRIADLILDTKNRRVERSGQVIDLSLKEFALLQYLMENRGKTLSRMQISENVWDIHFDTTTNIIDVHINRLRKKVDHGFNPQLIHTIRGLGYTLEVM